MRRLMLFSVFVVLAGCSSNVGQTVMQDFGLQDRPDDYVSGEQRVMQNMRAVGVQEMKRLNTLNRRGEIIYEEGDNFQGKYFKQVKVYERAYAVDASPEGRRSNRTVTGFTGTIEYAYQYYEGRREANRTNAEAADAVIPTGRTGRDRFRYHFSTSGNWDGNAGDSLR